MKKKIILLPTFLLTLFLITGCTLLPTKTAKPTQPEPKTMVVTGEEMEDLEKVSKLIFTIDKESLENEDLTEEKKAEIARQLQENFLQVTGKEMIQEFQNHFGKDQTVTFKDIDCGMDHGNEEENALYIFDKEQDKYIYNDKHPGHGGGWKDSIDFKMDFAGISIKGNEYHYNVKIMFYGKYSCPDAGICTYGKAYKSYKDAKAETNALTEIDNNEKYTTTNPYTGVPETHMSKVLEDMKDKLDTYEFIFEKEDDNLIFKSYSVK